ncbi:tetratricopeptide repeat protein [Streptomyces sp. TRM 70351]|uniref:tetratricopeptide repeat protein n=1 Tax=Streptomyces sp. TRM 70351 TaxID=3116552 RepID=UPI002E7AF8F8|nr:tetratricopeptide repeat protein [Streptomyces sp. TRM 70351]MEE1929514.1 tetratricopeptide repeat protein [Streptomyces sp. TRM 70351]
MDLGMIQQWYPVGTDVVVYLAGGRSARGRLEAIGADSLVLVTEKGPTLLNATAVEQVEPMSPAAPAPAPAPPAPPPSPSPAPAPAPAPVVLSAAWDVLETEFSTDPRQARLTTPVFGLDPSVELGYTEAKEIEGHINRARNRLDSARRLGEPARAPGAIRDLAAAAAACDYPPAFHLAALLLLERSSTEAARHQAEAWMAEAVHCGHRYVWDLAVLRMRHGHVREATATLGEALSLGPADHSDDVLLRLFLALVLQEGDGSAAASVLGAAAEESPGQRRVATRASLYLASRLSPERAAPLEPLLASSALSPDDLSRALETLGPDPAGRPAAPPPTVRPPAAATAPQAYPAPGGRPGPPPPAPAPHTPGPRVQPVRSTAGGPGKAPGPREPHLHVAAARNQLNQGNLDAALKIAQNALAGSPGHAELLEIAETARREKAARTPATTASRRTAPPQLPRGRRSAYVRAQHADTQEKDWPKAEQLYRQALTEDPDNERARRSLAWGLHRYKRSDEALELLRDPGVVVQDTLPHQNMIITILSDTGNWDEAARLLEDLLKREHSKQTRTGLLKRLIVLYRRLRDAERAKGAAQRLLNHGPRNPEFRSLWEEVEKAERSGIWDRIDQLLTKSDWKPEQSGSISPILLLHLDRCEYAGVNPARVQEGTLSERDVQELDELIRTLGSRRSADRAAYNLSAARILRDLNQTEDDRFHKSLRSFGAAMGDLCTAERRHGDVTRTYYAEAVALGGWDDMGELKVKQFVLSYLDPDWPQPESRPTFEKCLQWVLEDESLHKPLTFGLLSLMAAGSDRVRREIVSRTFRVVPIRDVLIGQLCGYLAETKPSSAHDVYAELWQEALRKLRQELDAQRQSLQLPLNRSEPLGALAEDQQLLERARDLAPTTPLDIDRLKKVATTLADIHGYLDQPSYLEQERLESKNRTAVRELVATIEAYPTRLSLEYLVPLLTKLDRALAGHFGDVQRAAEPTDLEVTKVLSSYAPNAASTIHVQLSVKNLPRRSPAVDVTLRVLDNTDDYQPVVEPIPVAHSLRDEQTETCTLPLVVTPRAVAEQVLTLHYSLEFMVRSDRRIVTEPRTLPLRLNDSQDWKPIRNPYAEGAPVEDEEMFYGRGPLIQILVDSLERADAKCVVIYGQKRVGKSSVLHHLQRALKPPVLAAKFSMGGLATNLTHAGLLYKISNAFFRRLEDLEDEGLPGLDLSRPVLREFIDSGSPEIHFDDYMRDILRRMQRSDTYRNWRMVLLLDEFTVLYGAIARGDLPREFMKLWKAMLESKLFSSVVVGNDLMPRFLKAFPNEFQVARQEPVSYLDEGPAKALITEPIALENEESRYRGDSVQRVIELTARSPYYIQLFCNRLVQHMNAERQPLIGPADVDNVAAALVSGDRALVQEQFDNLLTPGDADVSDLSEETVLGVLKGSLSGHRRDLHLDGRKARELTEGPRVIDDLLRRDVIVRESEDRYRIKVGLFAEWLWHRKA